MKKRKDEAKVDESSRESMGASDAPAWAGGVEKKHGEAARGDTRELWPATFSVPKLEPLAADATADVVVVGAGVAGLSAAYQLAKRGKKVLVLDSAGIGAGETAATTAHLTSALDLGWSRLERRHGAAAARLAFASHERAIDFVERVCAVERIDCDFTRVDGWMLLGEHASPLALRSEYEAALRCGLPAEFTKAPDGFGAGPAIRLPRQARFHPLKYLAGLAAALERHGGSLRRARVVSVTDGRPARVELEGGLTVEAADVIVAANVPVNDRVTMHTRLAAYRSYVIAAPVPRGMIADALYWDTAEPYHYVRVARLPACDLLVVGGEDHKTGQEKRPQDRFDALERWARGRFPGLGATEFRWSGQVIEPADGLAFIGLNPGDERVFIATGFSGNGMTYAAIGGLLLADLIAGGKNAYADLYNPGRGRVRGAPAWLKENSNAVARYADWAKPGDCASEDDIAPGQGCVVRKGLSKVAAYRAEDGSLHEMSAVCPHLGGLVCWNPAEKTWDCPVHGSRFDTNGKVLNGPATTGLREVPEPGKKPEKPTRRRA